MAKCARCWFMRDSTDVVGFRCFFCVRHLFFLDICRRWPSAFRFFFGFWCFPQPQLSYNCLWGCCTSWTYFLYAPRLCCVGGGVGDDGVAATAARRRRGGSGAMAVDHPRQRACGWTVGQRRSRRDNPKKQQIVRLGLNSELN